MARDRSRTPAGRSSASDSDLFGDVQLNVQTPTGKNIALDVHVADTIDSVKAKICSGAKIWGDDLHLVVKLKGGSKLSDYNLPNGCTLHLVKTSFRISVKAKRDVPKYVWSLIKIEVEASSCIGWLKERIQEATGIPPAVQRLTFDGTQLEDDRTISSYNMEKDDKIKCMWDGTL